MKHKLIFLILVLTFSLVQGQGLLTSETGNADVLRRGDMLSLGSNAQSQGNLGINFPIVKAGENLRPRAVDERDISQLGKSSSEGGNQVRQAEGRASARYLALEKFIQRHSFKKGLVNDGSTYAPTPYSAVFDIFTKLKNNLGDLKGRRLLDFGSGDLRISLVASYLYQMKTIAVEKDGLVSQRSMPILYEAMNQGFISNDDVHFLPYTDALNISWRDFDIVFFFYTQPYGHDIAQQFRGKLQEKAKELNPGAVLAMLFTRNQLAAGFGIFPHLSTASRPPLRVSADMDGLYLQIYQPTISNRPQPRVGIFQPARKLESSVLRPRAVDEKRTKPTSRKRLPPKAKSVAVLKATRIYRIGIDGFVNSCFCMEKENPYIYVDGGYIAITATAKRLFSWSVGPCVCLIVWDPKKKIGIMAHINMWSSVKKLVKRFKKFHSTYGIDVKKSEISVFGAIDCETGRQNRDKAVAFLKEFRLDLNSIKINNLGIGYSYINLYVKTGYIKTKQMFVTKKRNKPGPTPAVPPLNNRRAQIDSSVLRPQAVRERIIKLPWKIPSILAKPHVVSEDSEILAEYSKFSELLKQIYDELLADGEEMSIEFSNEEGVYWRSNAWAIACFLNYMGVSEGDTFLDLGSARGELLFFLCHLFNINATGVEAMASYHDNAVSIMRLLVNRGYLRQGQTSLINKNFLNENIDFSKYSIIYYFAWGTKRKKELAEKFSAIKPGCRILIYGTYEPEVEGIIAEDPTFSKEYMVMMAGDIVMERLRLYVKMPDSAGIISPVCRRAIFESV